MHLPFEGEISKAPHRRFDETVVFVHHFGGNKIAPARHVKFVNELGFDAVVFNLQYEDAAENPNKSLLKILPITGDLKFGARHIWAEQIESIFNSIPGRKIVYSFSMPTNSAVEAIARRHGEDIAGLVCDGGPFLQLPKCVWNLYEHEFGVKSVVLRAAFTALSLALYGPWLEYELPKVLEQIPRHFPVLSIRGLSDNLVPENAIDEFFAKGRNFKIERLAIAESGHLDGLKKHPEEYRSGVEKFLKSLATSVAADF